MTKADELVDQALLFIDALQRQKDEHLRTMANTDSTPIQQAFSSERVKVIDAYIDEAKKDLDAARRLQFRVTFTLSPEMVRATMPAKRRAERKRA